MAVNLLTKYGKVLDQAFKKGLYTDKAVNQDYDFTGAKTIEVLTITTQALSNYDRTATGDRFGGNNELQDTKTTYTITQDKGFKITIDNGNYQDQGELKKAATVLKHQMEEQVYPAVDKNRFTVAASAVAGNGQKVVYKPADAYDNVLDMSAHLDENEVPQEGRFLFVTPDFYKAVKKQIVTTAQAPTSNDKLIQKGFVGELDGTPVIKVPASYMPTNYKALMWHKKSLLGVKKINTTKIINDSELVDGAVLIGRFYFDTFVLSAKKKGIAGVATQ